VVIGNPPYGALFEQHHSDYLMEKFRVFRDGVRDVYACFMEVSFTLARKGGQIGFIVPSAWLGGPDYNPLRKELLKWRIEAVLDLPFDVFPDAYVDTVVVLLRREASVPRSIWSRPTDRREERPAEFSLLRRRRVPLQDERGHEPVGCVRR
jgi:hypothetical protein